MSSDNDRSYLFAMCVELAHLDLIDAFKAHPDIVIVEIDTRNKEEHNIVDVILRASYNALTEAFRVSGNIALTKYLFIYIPTLDATPPPYLPKQNSISDAFQVLEDMRKLKQKWDVPVTSIVTNRARPIYYSELSTVVTDYTTSNFDGDTY